MFRKLFATFLVFGLVQIQGQNNVPNIENVRNIENVLRCGCGLIQIAGKVKKSHSKSITNFFVKKSHTSERSFTVRASKNPQPQTPNSGDIFVIFSALT